MYSDYPSTLSNDASSLLPNSTIYCESARISYYSHALFSGVTRRPRTFNTANASTFANILAIQGALSHASPPINCGSHGFWATECSSQCVTKKLQRTLYKYLHKVVLFVFTYGTVQQQYMNEVKEPPSPDFNIYLVKNTPQLKNIYLYTRIDYNNYCL